MNRFAALLDLRPAEGETSAGIGVAHRVETDLTRRHGPSDAAVADHAILLQSGPGKLRQQGPLTLAGDLGLTDLPQLRGALSLGPSADMADLVLAAWLRWGDAAPERLNGTFCFVIHDRRSGTMTAVRDRFGVRPLAYACAAGRLVIAQDLSTVRAGLDREPDINDRWVADFLTGRLTSAEDTAMAGILRLPAGHMLTAGPGTDAPRLSQWYRLADRSDPVSGDDRAQALRAALTHATREAAALGPAATMLSGGLDSSTLSLLSVGDDAAPPLPRPALSLRYADPALDEGRFIDAVLDRAGGRLESVSLPGAADATLFDLDPLLDEQDQPVFAPGLIGNRMLYRAARQAGCCGVIDGHGGDEIIGGDFSDTGWLVDQGQWAQALRLAVRYARFTDSPPREALGLLLSWRGRRGFGRLGRWLAPQQGDDPVAWRSLVDADLASRTGLVERVRAQHDAPAQGARGGAAAPWAMRHAALLSSPAIAAGFETMDRSARAAGIVPHYPFYDHRVVELCVWQPGPERILDGQPRALLRRAMQGVLPEQVRLRQDKTSFLSDFWGMMRRDPAGRIAALRAGATALDGWVDQATLRRDLARLGDGGAADARTAFRLWRVVWLAAWLNRGRAAGPLDAAVVPRQGMSAVAHADPSSQRTRFSPMPFAGFCR